MSLDNEKQLGDDKIEDLKAFISHLAVIGFNGTLLLSFSKGTLSSVSKKDELIPGKLREVARRSVYVKLKKTPAKAGESNTNPTDGEGGIQ